MHKQRYVDSRWPLEYLDAFDPTFVGPMALIQEA
jgi:hypothetical protein